MRILIAEDDLNIRNALSDIFQAEGYEILLASNGSEALRLFETASPDLICLDIMMPELNGYDVCREIRGRGSTAPVIFISAKSEEIDKVLGLELGADDYIVKPFGLREVLARVRAVRRRYNLKRIDSEDSKAFRMGSLEILPEKLKAYRDGEVIELSLRDIEILRILHDRKGRVVDRDTLFREIWGLDHIPNSRTLDQHISQLRKRIESDPKNPTLIKTVRGVGYRYEG